MSTDLEREVRRLYTRSEKFRELANFWDQRNDELSMAKARLLDALKESLDHWIACGVSETEYGKFMRLESLLAELDDLNRYTPRTPWSSGLESQVAPSSGQTLSEKQSGS